MFKNLKFNEAGNLKYGNIHFCEINFSIVLKAVLMQETQIYASPDQTGKQVYNRRVLIESYQPQTDKEKCRYKSRANSGSVSPL